MGVRVRKESFVTRKRFTLSRVVVTVADRLQSHPCRTPGADRRFDAGGVLRGAHGNGAETLADAPPPPARARFDAADRKAFVGSAFGYLSELSEEVGRGRAPRRRNWRPQNSLGQRAGVYGPGCA